MMRYSVKRGRRIKKYKKSRKGCGRRGRRSVRNGKTIKSKIFMKTKRNNVGKRRRMVGGVEQFPFRITSEEILTYIHSHIDSTVTGLTLIGYCIAFVTKLGGRFGNVANRKNRLEYLVFFRDINGTIYIARAIYPNDGTKLKFVKTTRRFDLTGMIYDVLKVNIIGITRSDVLPEDSTMFIDNLNGIKLTTENMVFQATVVDNDSYLRTLAEEQQKERIAHALNELRVANGRDAIVVANGDTHTSVFYDYNVYDEKKKAHYSIIIPTSSLPNTVSTLLYKLTESSSKRNFIITLPIVTYSAVPKPDLKSTAALSSSVLDHDTRFGFVLPSSDLLTPGQLAEKERNKITDSFYSL